MCYKWNSILWEDHWIDATLKDRIPNKMYVSPGKYKYIQKMKNNTGEIMSYDLGVKGFWKDMFVNNNVLDPRYDSECIVEEVLKYIPENENSSIIELGVGSGCLILSVLRERLQCNGVGVDIDPLAIKTANRNANRLKLKHRIIFHQSDWWCNVNGKYDILIVNPPYIPIDDINIHLKDPYISLYGGYDGNECYRKIIPYLATYVKNYAFIEFGDFHRFEIILKEYNIQDYKIVNDLSGKPRLCVININGIKSKV